MLQETWIDFEVIQEYSSGGKGERLGLGNIKLNLAEYVEASEHSQGKDEEGVTRRYLMQESKINSTLKVCSSSAFSLLPCSSSTNIIFRSAYICATPKAAEITMLLRCELLLYLAA